MDTRFSARWSVAPNLTLKLDLNLPLSAKELRPSSPISEDSTLAPSTISKGQPSKYQIKGMVRHLFARKYNVQNLHTMTSKQSLKLTNSSNISRQASITRQKSISRQKSII